jgi:hypothetical protein
MGSAVTVRAVVVKEPEEDCSPVVHAYELDGPTRKYVPTGIHRGTLRTSRPFAITIDLDGLRR